MSECEKHEQWISDAALGAFEPRRERELLAHAGECDACREAYQHARELAALIDRGVESLVAGEPSSHFAARLRSRIAGEQPRRQFAWLAWRPFAAGLVSVVALALLIAVLLPKHRHFGPDAVRPNPTTPSAARIQAPVAAESPTTNPPRRAGQNRVRGGVPPPPQAARRTTPSHPQVASRFGSHGKSAVRLSWASRNPDARTPGSSSAVGRHNSPTEPEVLVPPGQLEAVMQLAADIRSGRIDRKQFIAEQRETDKPLKIDPIEIPPLVKPQPYLYPPSDTLPDSSEP
ncbi:MAG: anti-sigma factor family protein [Candidatus Acidiferrales bacterium]